MESVLDFVYAALPWVSTGLLLAVFFARSVHKKKTNEKGEDYGIEGMCLGMSMGIAIEASFAGNVGIGITLGMLLGLVIGSLIKKDSEKGDE